MLENKHVGPEGISEESKVVKKQTETRSVKTLKDLGSKIVDIAGIHKAKLSQKVVGFADKAKGASILTLMKMGQSKRIADNLDTYSDLSKEVAVGLIDKGFAYNVLQNLDSFTGLDKEVCLKLIDARYFGLSIINRNIAHDENPSIFVRFDALAFLPGAKLKYGFMDKFLDHFTGLDIEVKERFIKLGESPYVKGRWDMNKYIQKQEHINKFSGANK